MQKLSTMLSLRLFTRLTRTIDKFCHCCLANTLVLLKKMAAQTFIGDVNKFKFFLPTEI
jgi:hypothetical protein